ncbi:MAG: MarR family winged helix-turn-helix transcriptional regulator [Acidimicrobiia bacterium]|nr:MAG: MarR family winged helix-turn-helix transcriptional regulator [Acidimicrobiia bacterium]
MPSPTNLSRLLLDRFRWFDQALLTTLHDRLGVQLTSAQSLLFANLPLQGARQSDLARRLGVSRQAVNELVGGLEKRGLVELVADPNSGRSKLVRPTTQGRKSIDVALETFARLEKELRARIGERVVDQLRGALDADWGDPPGGE